MKDKFDFITVVLIRDLQRNRTCVRVSVYMCICEWVCMFKEIYYEVLAHKIMESKKSHNMPSASWQPREADDTVQRAES